MYLCTKFIYTWQGQVVTNTLEISFQEHKNGNINLSVIFNIASQYMCLEKNPSAICVSQWLNNSEQLWPMWIMFYCILKYVLISKCKKLGNLDAPKFFIPVIPRHTELLRKCHSGVVLQHALVLIYLIEGSQSVATRANISTVDMAPMQHLLHSQQLILNIFWRRKKEGERGSEQHNKGKMSLFSKLSLLLRPQQ